MNKKMLLLTLEYPPFKGGVARYYENLVKFWSKGIVVLSQKLLWPLWPRWLMAVWQAGRTIKKEGIELLGIGQVLPLGYVGLWFKRRKGIPYIVFCHGMDVLAPQNSKWKKKWLVKILQEADWVVANSEFTKMEIEKLGVGREKILVIYPCGGLPENFLKKQKIASLKKIKILLSVGRLVKRKGFDRVIETMPRILKRVPDAQYVIIGDGPEKTNLELRISSLGLKEKVIILDDVSDGELASWYASCDVFVMPCCQIETDVEGFGMVFLEAAGFGKPVVAGNSGGVPEAVRDGYGGYVVNPESEEELYQALVKLLTDAEFAQRMGKYGREWVKRNFEWRREVEKIKIKINDCQ